MILKQSWIFDPHSIDPRRHQSFVWDSSYTIIYPQRLHTDGLIHHAMNGEINYFDWAILDSKLFVRGYSILFSCNSVSRLSGHGLCIFSGFYVWYVWLIYPMVIKRGVLENPRTEWRFKKLGTSPISSYFYGPCLPASHVWWNRRVIHLAKKSFSSHIICIRCEFQRFARGKQGWPLAEVGNVGVARIPKSRQFFFLCCCPLETVSKLAWV